MQKTISAGAAATDITPPTPQFLYGYPHVERISTGVHDPLLSSALFLSDGQNRVLVIANDVIFISKALAQRVRSRIREKTGIPETSILIAATHTHSGPVTVDYISNTSDPLVPPADRDYLDFLQDRIVEAALNAVKTNNLHKSVWRWQTAAASAPIAIIPAVRLIRRRRFCCSDRSAMDKTSPVCWSVPCIRRFCTRIRR
jgi:hypothetical protein